MSIKIKSCSKGIMNTKGGCPNTIISMKLEDNDKCHMALPQPSHSLLWSALNEEIDIGIL